MAAMLFDGGDLLDEFDLLHRMKLGSGGFESSPAKWAMGKAVVERGVRKLISRKQSPLVLGMTGLTTRQTFLLVQRGLRFRWFDNVRRRRLGRRGGIFASRSELLLKQGNAVLQSPYLGADGLQVGLQPLAVPTVVRLLCIFHILAL